MKDQFGLSPEKQKKLIEFKHENTRYAKVMGFENSNQRFAKITGTPQHFKNKDGIYEDIDINFIEENNNYLCTKRNINISFSKNKKLDKFVTLKTDKKNIFDILLNNLEINSEKIKVDKFKDIKVDNKNMDEYQSEVIHELTDDIIIKNIITDDTFQLLVNNKTSVNKFKMEFKIKLKGFKCINKKNNDGTEYLLNNANGFTFVGTKLKSFTINKPFAYSNDMKNLFYLEHKLFINNKNELTYIKYFDKLPENIEDSSNIWIDLYIIDDINSTSDLIDAIITQSERQRWLQNQTHTVNLDGTRLMNPDDARSERAINGHQLRIMHAALGLIRGMSFSEIESRYPETNHPLNNYINEINIIINNTSPYVENNISLGGPTYYGSSHIESRILIGTVQSGLEPMYYNYHRYPEVTYGQQDYLVKKNDNDSRYLVYSYARRQYHPFMLSGVYDQQTQYGYQGTLTVNNMMNNGNNLAWEEAKHSRTYRTIPDLFAFGVDYGYRGTTNLYNSNPSEDIWGYNLRRLELNFEAEFIKNLGNINITSASIRLYGHVSQNVTNQPNKTAYITTNPKSWTSIPSELDSYLVGSNSNADESWPGDYGGYYIASFPDSPNYININLYEQRTKNYIKNHVSADGTLKFLFRSELYDVYGRNPSNWVGTPILDSYTTSRYQRFFIANSNDPQYEHRPALFITYQIPNSEADNSDIHWVTTPTDVTNVGSGQINFSFNSTHDWVITDPRPQSGDYSSAKGWMNYCTYNTNGWGSTSPYGDSNPKSSYVTYPAFDYTESWHWNEYGQEYRYDVIEIRQEDTGKSIYKNVKRYGRTGFYTLTPSNTLPTKYINDNGSGDNIAKIEIRGTQLPTMTYSNPTSKPDWVNSVNYSISNWELGTDNQYHRYLNINISCGFNNTTTSRTVVLKFTDQHGIIYYVTFTQANAPVITISPTSRREFKFLPDALYPVGPNGEFFWHLPQLSYHENSGDVTVTSNCDWYMTKTSSSNPAIIDQNSDHLVYEWNSDTLGFQGTGPGSVAVIRWPENNNEFFPAGTTTIHIDCENDKDNYSIWGSKYHEIQLRSYDGVIQEEIGIRLKPLDLLPPLPE